MVWQATLVLAAAIAPATAQEKTVGYDAVLTCFEAQAVRLDDGTSDPISIARVMVPACDPELLYLADLLTRGEKRADRKRTYLIQELRMEYTVPASIVLQLRKRKAAQ